MTIYAEIPPSAGSGNAHWTGGATLAIAHTLCGCELIRLFSVP